MTTLAACLILVAVVLHTLQFSGTRHFSETVHIWLYLGSISASTGGLILLLKYPAC